MKVLIDTCVIIDALQKRDPFFQDAQNLLLLAADDDFEGYVSAKSAIDVRYIIRKHSHSEIDSRYILNVIYDFLTIIDTTGEDCINALISNNNDYEDAVLVEGAKRSGIDYIVTRNIKDYADLGIPAIEPSKLIDMIIERA
ncbi:MAG: PIN domain-containing protein [Bacilli bacterium]|nr:PIN domain-containing protein [Bacilli bacterium]